MEDQMLERVRNLIAKAEATNHPAEAEAFMAKAQELMAKHSIVEAMIAESRSDKGKPTCKVFYCEKPYASQKWTLLNRVARANYARTVGSGDARSKVRVEVYGFEGDLEAIETLYTSLLVQCVSQMRQAEIPWGVHGKTFNVSFMTGFADAIGSRLAKAKRDAEAEVQKELAGATGPGMALVLVGKKEAVDEAVAVAHPKLRTRSVSGAGSNAGYGAGREAGSNAALGGKQVGAGRRGLTG